MGTKSSIIEVAREIFLEKGFKKANIRDIASAAEVSTGAIYGSFENKEKLFEASIGPLPKEYYHKYLNAVSKIDTLDYKIILKKMKTNHIDGIELFLDYVYADPIAWKLVMKGDGTNYYNHLDIVIEKEIEAFCKYLDILQENNIYHYRPKKNVITCLISNLIHDLMEVVTQNLEREEAFEFANQISQFFFDGWANLLKIESFLSSER